MSALYIDDGYTLTGTIPARPGICPAVMVEFRPAVDRKRLEFQQKLAAADPAKTDVFVSDLIATHVVSLNGEEVDKARVGKMNPVVRAKLVDLVLLFEPADVPANEAADAGN